MKYFKYMVTILSGTLIGSILFNLKPSYVSFLVGLLSKDSQGSLLSIAIYNGAGLIIVIALLGYINIKYLAFIILSLSGVIYGILASEYIYSTGGIKCIIYCMVILLILFFYNLILYNCLNKTDICCRKTSGTILNDVLILGVLIVVITLEKYVLVLF